MRQFHPVHKPVGNNKKFKQQTKKQKTRKFLEAESKYFGVNFISESKKIVHKPKLKKYKTIHNLLFVTKWVEIAKSNPSWRNQAKGLNKNLPLFWIDLCFELAQQRKIDHSFEIFGHSEVGRRELKFWGRTYIARYTFTGRGMEVQIIWPSSSDSSEGTASSGYLWLKTRRIRVLDWVTIS